MPSLPEILDRIKKTLEENQAYIEGHKGLRGLKLHVRLDKGYRVEEVQMSPDTVKRFTEK